MNRHKLKVVYDKQSQVLSWQLSKNKSVDSDVQGNVVLDYDGKGKIVRINFYDFDFDDFKHNKPKIMKFNPSGIFVKA